MRPLDFFSKVRIGAKLGICMGFGGLLVAGMIVNEQISSNAIKALTEAADLQQATVIQSAKSEVVLQRARIASRDLRMARTAEEIGTLLGQLQELGSNGRQMLDALEAHADNPQDRERFQKISRSFQDYLAALGETGGHQARILENFNNLEQVELKWIRSVNRAVNSSAFANLPNYGEVEGFVNEAV